jgi:uncharacterized protein YneF (UPF0154 family)
MDTLVSAQISASEYVTQSDLTNLYRDFVTSQADNYSILFTVLLTITALLLGFSLIWNFVISRNQIKKQVKDAVKEMEEILRKEIEKKIAEETKESSNAILLKLKESQADLARLYALNTSILKYSEISINWWIIALELYSATNSESWIQKCVISLLTELKSGNCPTRFTEEYTITKYREQLEVIKNNIPEILSIEKKEIIKLFKAKKPIEEVPEPELPFKQ